MEQKVRGRVTIHDVATAAGVSVTTVSHALNDKGEVSSATRELIRTTAASMGYRPSRAAQALRGSRTSTIALILPSGAEDREMISLDYYMTIASACAASAFERGHSLILPPRLETADEWRQIDPDGVILCDPATNDPRIALLESMGIPVVSIERDAGRPDRPYYASGDNAANAIELLDHLWSGGARRIGLLWPESSWAWAVETRSAYESWCRDRGQDVLVAEVSLHHLAVDSYRAASALLDSPAPPDALFASAERYSDGVLRACRERGLRVPDDVMVASGIDGHLTQQSDPPVTAIDLMPDQQARAAIDMLVARLSDLPVSEPRLVPSRLHVRASTRRAP